MQFSGRGTNVKMHLSDAVKLRRGDERKNKSKCNCIINILKE